MRGCYDSEKVKHFVVFHKGVVKMKKKTIKKVLAVMAVIILLFGFTDIFVLSLSSVEVSEED